MYYGKPFLKIISMNVDSGDSAITVFSCCLLLHYKRWDCVYRLHFPDHSSDHGRFIVREAPLLTSPS